MKNSSKRIFALLMLFISVAMFSIVAVSTATASTPQIHTTLDDSVEIDVKYKKATAVNLRFFLFFVWCVCGFFLVCFFLFLLVE